MRLEQLIRGDDSLQQHLASERDKNALLIAVSPLARKAIEKEILPQLNEAVVDVKVVGELCETTKQDIETAFKNKSEIYTRLIQYKSIDQSDIQFLKDLLYVMDEWSRKTRRLLEEAPIQSGEVGFDIGAVFDPLKLER